MPIVFNATEEKQTFRAFGSWFTFNPNQTKQMNEDISRFIAENRKEHGMMVLPDEFEDPEYKLTEEGKTKLANIKSAGIFNFLTAQRDIIKNNQVHLRKDLEMANIKTDPAVYATDSELKAMEYVAKYQKLDKDDAQEKIDKVKNLMKEVNN